MSQRNLHRRARGVAVIWLRGGKHHHQERDVCAHGSNAEGVKGKWCSCHHAGSPKSCQDLSHQPAAYETSIRLPVMLIMQEAADL